MEESVAIDVSAISKRFSKNNKSTRKQLRHIIHECFFWSEKTETT